MYRLSLYPVLVFRCCISVLIFRPYNDLFGVKGFVGLS